MPDPAYALPSQGRLGDEFSSAPPLRWWRRLSSGYPLGIGYGLACALTALGVWLAAQAPVNREVGRTSRLILSLLSFNMVLILALAAAVGWQVFRLIVDQRRDAGARLHLRFVILFAGAAVAPALAVALVFGVLVTQGVDRWFGDTVRTVVENIASVAKSYEEAEANDIGNEMQIMAVDLNANAAVLQQAPIRFSQDVLGRAASYHRFEAAYVIDRDGHILARATIDNPPPYLAPPTHDLDSADGGDAPIQNFDSIDAMGAVMPLKGINGAYLYVLRHEEPGLLAKLDQSSDALTNYRDSANSRARIKSDFALSFLETTLLVLVGAVWLGMRAANGISAPVASLVQAADRVAGGDLTARVSIDRAPKELSDLAGSFNRMTGDLQTQQAALRAASDEAESRRQFIETVLAGVSAGVIGLDRDGTVSASNRQALVLLGLPAGGVNALPFDVVAPELADVARAAVLSGEHAEAEVDVTRDGETRRLRVRASVPQDGGLVLTFDDITRLVAAQRNAAWKDVARRIAHEIKNPLTPIQLSAERIRRKYRKDIQSDLETFDRCTDTIIRQVGDIGRMVDEFSAFARMPTPQFAEADMAELLRQAVFAQRVTDPATAIEMVDAPATLIAVCDARMIGQALTNVLKIAGEAVLARRLSEPGLKGQITARVTTHEDDLLIEIEDNGVGLPAKDRHRLTEPYVTTREKGTGLGLAIVKRILEDHGGDLSLHDARTRPGARAVLRIARGKGASASINQGVAVA